MFAASGEAHCRPRRPRPPLWRSASSTSVPRKEVLRRNNSLLVEPSVQAISRFATDAATTFNAAVAKILRACELKGYALGSNAQGGAVEYGWLVLDAPLQTADRWALQFGQAAVLYWKRGEPVRLRMLWPRPDGSIDQSHTDWAG